MIASLSLKVAFAGVGLLISVCFHAMFPRNVLAGDLGHSATLPTHPVQLLYGETEAASELRYDNAEVTL